MTDVTVDTNAADILEPEFIARPIQVEETDVMFMPKKDFEARINQERYYFSKDVPKKIPRSVANMLLEDSDRGYIRL